jgi:hypothetical protein
MNSFEIFLFGSQYHHSCLERWAADRFFCLNRRRKNVFSHLAQALEMLGFTKRGWTRQLSAILVREPDGYYSATIDGKPFEAHFYAVGGFRFKLICQPCPHRGFCATISSYLGLTQDRTFNRR